MSFVFNNFITCFHCGTTLLCLFSFPSFYLVSNVHLQPYEPQLFRLCVQCLAAVAKALPPDHTDTGCMSATEGKASTGTGQHFDPQPIDTSK